MRLHYQLAIAVAIVAGGLFGWFAFSTGGAGGDARQQTRFPTPVDVTAARSGHVAELIEVVGTARAREAVTVVARGSGRVSAIGFEEGQQVAAGAVLFELDSAQQQAELREAQAQLRDARAHYQRAKSLSDGRNIAEAEVESRRTAVDVAQARVDIARARLRDQQVVAPFAGIVGSRSVSLGALVDPQTRLTTLDDLTSVRLDFNVPERFLASLAAGGSLYARSSAFPERRFEGRITHLDSRIDPVTRSVRVQALIPNPETRLRPGMFLTIELVLSERDQAVLVPEEALIIEGPRRYVYVVEADQARRTRVDSGVRREGQVELRSGVTAGELVVVGGNHRLRGDRADVSIRRDLTAAH